MLPPPCIEKIHDFSKRKVWGRIVLQFRAGEIINVEVAESVTLERNGGAKAGTASGSGSETQTTRQ